MLQESSSILSVNDYVSKKKVSNSHSNFKNWCFAPLSPVRLLWVMSCSPDSFFSIFSLIKPIFFLSSSLFYKRRESFLRRLLKQLLRAFISLNLKRSNFSKFEKIQVFEKFSKYWKLNVVWFWLQGNGRTMLSFLESFRNMQCTKQDANNK